MARLPPLVSFIAPSGTGKTTLIEGVLASLRDRGLRIGVIKHDAHRLHLDTPGKDSYRYRQAGAWRSLIASSEKLGFFETLSGPRSLGGLITEFMSRADLVIMEGYRDTSIPAIRVHRKDADDPGWSHGSANIIAHASDFPLDSSLPVLPLDEPRKVADYLLERFIQRRTHQGVTGLVAVGPGVEEPAIRNVLKVLKDTGLEEAVVVSSHEIEPIGTTRIVRDIRPGLGPLGALFTGLAAVSTPNVLFIDTGRPPPPARFLAFLLAQAPHEADICVPIRGGRPMPFPGLYGHRCLSAIQSSLLSGEGRIDSWWGEVDMYGIPETDWRKVHPTGSF